MINNYKKPVRAIIPPHKYSLTCEYCNKPFTSSYQKAKYCGRNCRVMKREDRKIGK